MSNPYQVFLKHTSLAIETYKVWKDIWNNCDNEKKVEIYGGLNYEDGSSITRRLQYNRRIIFRANRPDTKEIKKSVLTEAEWDTLNWAQADLCVAGLAILKKYGHAYGKNTYPELDSILENLSEEILMNAIDTNQKNRVNELVVKNKEALKISEGFFKKYFWLNVPEKMYDDFSEIVMKNKSITVLNVMMKAMDDARNEYLNNKASSSLDSGFSSSLSFKITNARKNASKSKEDNQKKLKERRVFQAGYVFLDAIHVLLRKGAFDNEEKREVLQLALNKVLENYRTDTLVDKVIDMANEAKKTSQNIDYKNQMFLSMSTYEYIFALNSKKQYTKNELVSLVTLTKEPNRLKHLMKVFAEPGMLNTQSELNVYESYWRATTDFELLKNTAQKQNWVISEEEWMMIVLRYANSWGKQDKISGYLLETQMRNSLKNELEKTEQVAPSMYKVKKF